MDEIYKEITEQGISSKTLDAFLAKLGTALEEAYNAGENDQGYVAMIKIGEAKVYYDAALAIWKKLTEKA